MGKSTTDTDLTALISAEFNDLSDELYREVGEGLKDLTSDLFTEVSQEVSPVQVASAFSDLVDDLYGEVCEGLKDLTSDLLSEVEEKPVVKQKPKASFRKRGNRELEGANATMRYLMCDGGAIWSEWRNRLIQYCLRKNLVSRNLEYRQRTEEAEDLVSSFFCWIIGEDKLKAHLSDLKYNWVQAVMFVQWVQRQREADGQDALMRTRFSHCRTQQERKFGEYHLSTSDSATQVVQRDEDGVEESSDIYVASAPTPESECASDDLEKYILKVFERKARSDDEEALWGKTWALMEVQKTPSRVFESDTEWASAWGMEVRALRELRYSIQRMLRDDRHVQEALSR